MDQSNTVTPCFFCVPDITGFTRFVALADINFSKDVIPMLLRRLIDANILKMNVAEIEGDAIFFYKDGRLPTFKKVIEQCNHFHKIFSGCLASLKLSHPQEYAKYLSDKQLGLKIIVHYGQVSASNIKGRIKLLGEDVIVVHRLLKNNVEPYEYLLFSEKYLKKVSAASIKNTITWDKFCEGSETYEHIGEVKYKYIKPAPLQI